MDTPWVIGQQGNIDGEYWHGTLGTLIVYDRELTAIERERTIRWLMLGYDISEQVPPLAPVARSDARLRAWSSLCVVLFNSNEFLYVD